MLCCSSEECVGPLESASDVGWFRAVFALPNRTAPTVGAFVHTDTWKTPRFEYHSDPFVENNYTVGFPAPVAFEEAINMLLVGGAGFTGAKSFSQVTFRRPLYPCVSEDLMQFETEVGQIFSVGTQSKRLCDGITTQDVPLPMCAPANCSTVL